MARYPFPVTGSSAPGAPSFSTAPRWCENCGKPTTRKTTPGDAKTKSAPRGRGKMAQDQLEAGHKGTNELSKATSTEPSDPAGSGENHSPRMIVPWGYGHGEPPQNQERRQNEDAAIPAPPRKSRPSDIPRIFVTKSRS